MELRPLQLAITVSDVDSVRAILDEDATLVRQRDEFGHTALIWAASQGHVGIVGLLLARGPDVNAVASDGTSMTALMTAACRGHLDVVNLLLEHGARIWIPGGDSCALALACHRGHLAVVQRLIAHGGWRESADAPSLVYSAVESGSAGMLAAVLWAGAGRKENVLRWQLERCEERGQQESANFLKVSNVFFNTMLWSIRVLTVGTAHFMPATCISRSQGLCESKSVCFVLLGLIL
jgi:hypothetical protein